MSFGQTSAGQIGLDLVVNNKGFDQQMGKIQQLAQKAGKALASAFAIKSLVDFGKSCIDLGSDLTEVQNVVEQSFGSMTNEMDKWAKSAITQFGLSETMAKRYAGTFGAMSKAFGFTEKDAYDMSTTLTGLAGDLASFYNISQDDAYGKLKGVFTGETEGLKSLGVVMTQAALDEYALANGFGKVTAKMTEQEKVALRYQFVQSQLSTATGDFARTAGGSWANQIRILTLQFDSLKATIGQGLINLFLPIVKAINVVIGKLMVLAEAFRSFTEMITGKKASSGSPAAMAAETATAMTDAADSAANMADNTSSVGDAAKKAAKQMRALMGFDQINRLDDNEASDSSGGSGAGSGAGGLGGAGVSMGSLASGETIIDKTEKKVSSLMKRMQELGRLFKKGFSLSFGDSGKRIEQLQTNVSRIGTSVQSIFTDPKVTGAASAWIDSVAVALGSHVGAIASAGTSIAVNLTGGIAGYLEGSGSYITDRIASMFEVGTALNGMIANVNAAIAEIYTVFAGDNAQGCTAALIGIFSDGILGASDLLIKFRTDIYDLTTAPIVENAAKIKEVIDGLLGNLKTILDTLWTSVKATLDKLIEAYDEHVAPLIQSIKDGVSDIVAKFLEAWQTYIQPVLDDLTEKFTEVWTNHIQPAIDMAIELLGSICDLVKSIWETWVQPFIEWLVENVLAKVAPIISALGNSVLGLLVLVGGVIKGIMTFFNGIVTFLTGLIEGDWGLAFEGLEGCVTGFRDIIDTAVTFIKDEIITPFMTWMSETFGINWDTVFTSVSTTFENFKTGIKDGVDWLKRRFNWIIVFIKNTFHGKWKKSWESIKEVFSSVFSGLADMAKTPINAIITAFNSVISVVNGLINKINSISFNLELPGWLQELTGYSSVGFSGFNLSYLGYIPQLAKGGYVKANTPQLAMIGDNKHQGEVVAPEDKLREMAREAAEGGNQEVIMLLKAILELLGKIDPVELDPEALRKYFIRKTNQNTRSSGRSELVTT